MTSQSEFPPRREELTSGRTRVNLPREVGRILRQHLARSITGGVIQDDHLDREVHLLRQEPVKAPTDHLGVVVGDADEAGDGLLLPGRYVTRHPRPALSRASRTRSASHELRPRNIGRPRLSCATSSAVLTSPCSQSAKAGMA